MNKKFLITAKIIIIIVAFAIAQSDSCNDVLLQEKIKQSKIEILTLEQFPKLKIIPRIDSVVFRLNMEKYMSDVSKKLKHLVTEYFFEINLCNKVLNIGKNTAILKSVFGYFDTTNQNSLEEILTKIKNFPQNQIIESKLKFIEPEDGDLICINDTLLYNIDNSVWLNLFIIYENSSSLVYYKYYATKLCFEEFQFPIDLMNKVRKVATDIIMGKNFCWFEDKIEFSDEFSKKQLVKLKQENFFQDKIILD